MDETDDLYDVIVDGWERSETREGVPYFINHKSERTCWDHPYFVKILDELGEMDSVRYAAYRTAIKLRHLQKRLKLHLVSIHTVSSIFLQNGYPDGVDAVINCEDLLTILTELFTKLDHGKLSTADTHIHADLLQNLLLNCYDVNRTGCIKVLSLKLAIGVLSSARLSEKYKFFYRQLCDPSFFVSRKVMGHFLHDLLQLPELLQEASAFGGNNVTPSVESCIQLSGCGPGVSEDSFLSWLLKEPQTLIWLPTMHRVAASESVKHDAKCNVCKACPIIGFRYRCLKCFNCDICQCCFLSGRTGKGHKLKHPIQEYCLATSSKEDTKAFMKTIRNNLSKKHRRKNKPKYLPIDGSENYGPDEWSKPETIPSNLHPVVLKKANTLASTNKTPDVRDILTPIGPVQPNPANRKVRNNHVVHTPVVKGHNNNKENVLPQLSSPKQLESLGETRQNLEKMISELEEENRQLYSQLADIHHGEPSETESNASYTDELEEEKEVLEAKKEVLEHHNQSLNKQLSRVRQALKSTPLVSVENEYGDWTVDLSNLPESDIGIQHPSPRSLNGLDQSSMEDGSPVTIGDLCTPGDETRSMNPASRPQYTLHSPTDQQQQRIPLQAMNLSGRQEFSPYTLREQQQRVPLQPLVRGDNLDDWTPTHFFSPYLIKTRDLSMGSEQRVPNGYTPQMDSPYYANKSAWESIDMIEGNMVQSNFTLPSVNHSRYFPDEEAELDALVQKIETAFPTDMSYSDHYGRSRSYGVDGEMLGAANRVGEAMTQFVSATANQN